MLISYFITISHAKKWLIANKQHEKFLFAWSLEMNERSPLTTLLVNEYTVPATTKGLQQRARVRATVKIKVGLSCTRTINSLAFVAFETRESRCFDGLIEFRYSDRRRVLIGSFRRDIDCMPLIQGQQQRSRCWRKKKEEEKERLSRLVNIVAPEAYSGCTLQFGVSRVSSLIN